MPTPPLNIRRTAGAKPGRKRPYRLWPLLFLPLLGALGAVGVQRWLNFARPMGTGPTPNDLVLTAAEGFLLGTNVMIAVAVCIAVYRAARQRFTIRAILIAIAIVAIGLTLARAVLF